MADPNNTVAGYELNLEEYWQVIRRRRSIILFCAFAMGAFSWLFTWLNQPPAMYSSTTSVKVEKSTDLTGLLLQNLTYSPVDDMSTQLAMVESFLMIERVAKRLKLVPNNLTKEDVRANSVYMDRVLALKNSVDAEQEGNSGIINITATSDSPEFARDLAQAVADEFRALNIEEKNRRVFEAKRFIQQQIVVVGERLKRAEEVARNFRQEHNITSYEAETALMSKTASDLEEEYRRQSVQLSVFKFTLATLRERIKQGPWDYKAVAIEGAVSPYFDRLNQRLVELALKRTELSTNFTDAHPEIQELRLQGNDILSNMLGELAKQVNISQQRLSDLEKNIEVAQQKFHGVPEQTLELRRLEREVGTNEQLYNLLEAKYQEVQIKEAEKVEEVTMMRPALISYIRINPARTTETAIAGFMLGLVLGLIIALVIEAMDSSVGTIEEVESYLGSSVVGFLPSLNRDEAVKLFTGVKGLVTSGYGLERQMRMIVHFFPASVIAEAYRSMRTNLLFSQLGEYRVILVTSSTISEGKSTVASNLATVVAQQGARVLLIDADMRKPIQHKTFGLEQEPGLSECLLGQTPWRDAVRRISDVLLGDFGVDEALMTPGLDQLDIMTCGRKCNNPADLLASPAMDRLLEQVRAEYDMVILDMPPILHASDASVVAVKVDGVLLVYHIGAVVRGALKRVKTGVESVGGNVIGVVLNAVRGEVSADYNKYKMARDYAYGAHTEEEKKSWLERANARVRNAFRNSFRRGSNRGRD